MKDGTPLTVTLGSDKIAFLEEMAKKYHLPDVGKAVRILVDFARDNPAQHDLIFTEQRCIDCGG
jgi:hypothetical protein